MNLIRLTLNMNKRGATQKILLYTFYLVLAFLIIYTTAVYLSNYFNGYEFYKDFMAKDMGLAIDTISFSPAKIEMNYNSSKEIIAESSNHNLRIKLKDLEVPKQYAFISKIEDFSIKSNEITIKKDGQLTIG